jgi:hypothetical protein
VAPSPAGTTSYSVPVQILESGQEWSLFEEEVPREGASFSWMFWDLPRPKLRRTGPTRAPPMGERSVTARSEELAEQKRAEDAQMGEPLQLANLAVFAAEERHEQGGELTSTVIAVSVRSRVPYGSPSRWDRRPAWCTTPMAP